MSRIGQRLEKTPETTFLRELDEKDTNPASSPLSSSKLHLQHDSCPSPSRRSLMRSPPRRPRPPRWGRRALGPETRLRLLPVRR